MDSIEDDIKFLERASYEQLESASRAWENIDGDRNAERYHRRFGMLITLLVTGLAAAILHCCDWQLGHPLAATAVGAAVLTAFAMAASDNSVASMCRTRRQLGLGPGNPVFSYMEMRLAQLAYQLDSADVKRTDLSARLSILARTHRDRIRRMLRAEDDSDIQALWSLPQRSVTLLRPRQARIRDVAASAPNIETPSLLLRAANDGSGEYFIPRHRLH